MNLLIGLTGYARHGKDTVGALLRDEYGYQTFSFAAPLKELLLRINPYIVVSSEEARAAGFEQTGTTTWRYQDLVGYVGVDRAKQLPEVRRLLQQIGTRCREILGDDVWVQALERQLREARLIGGARGFAGYPRDYIVITDARFPNEVAWVHDLGGEVWRVKRVNEDRSPYDNGIGIFHDSEKHVAGLEVEREFEAATVAELLDAVRQEEARREEAGTYGR